MTVAAVRATPEIVTFYSYKGGTGRTMALANVGCLLAEELSAGEQILMIDWDLEAPGLHRYFRDQLVAGVSPGVDRDHATDTLPGLIEYFEAVAARLGDAKGTNFSRTVAEAAFATADLCEHTIATTLPGLRLMKAGRFDAEYPSRIATFSWQTLYTERLGIFQFFAEWLGKQFRYVLIDSRTGLSDTGGICTILLPDKLVLAFTANRQSLYGVTDLVARAAEHRRASDDHRPLLVLPLPSRIDTSEPELRRLWRYGDRQNNLPGYQTLLERAFAEAYDLSDCNLETYLDRVQIQHVASYSYGEYIAVLRDSTADRLSPAGGFAAFASYLRSDTLPWEEAAAPAEWANTPDAQISRAMASLKYEAHPLAQTVLARMLIIDPGSGEISPVPVFICELTEDERTILHELVSARIVATAGSDKLTFATLNRRYISSLTAQLDPKLADLKELLSWKRLFRPYFGEWMRAEKRSRVWPPQSVLSEGAEFLKHHPEMFSAEEKEFLDLGTRMSSTAGQVIAAAVKSSRFRRTLARSLAALALVIVGALVTFVYEKKMSADRVVANVLSADSKSLSEVMLQLAQLQHSIDKSRAESKLVEAADVKPTKQVDTGKLLRNVRPEELPLFRVALGSALNDNGDRTAAEEQYRQAIAEFRKRNDPVGEADASAGLAKVLKENGMLPEAAQAYQMAIAIQTKLGQAQKAAPLMTALSEIYRLQGNSKEAAAWMERSASTDPSEATASTPQPATSTGTTAPAR